jgi:hypothetical protein
MSHDRPGLEGEGFRPRGGFGHLRIDLAGGGDLTAAMRSLLTVILLGAFAVGGCVHRKTAEPPRSQASRAGAQAKFQPVVTASEIAAVGKVVLVNKSAQFVVLNFPLGRMAPVGQRLDLYRHGLKVGEVNVTGPQREDNTVADLVAGEAEVGDDARAR